MKITITKDPDGCWNVDGPYQRGGMSFQHMIEFVSNHYSDDQKSINDRIAEIERKLSELQKVNPGLAQFQKWQQKAWPPLDKNGNPVYPYHHGTGDPIPCLFNGLDTSKAYGISCPCPKCSPCSL